MKKASCVNILLLFLWGFASAAPWRFAVLGDTHVPDSDTIQEMIPFLAADSISFVLVSGDLAQAGKLCTSAKLQEQLTIWLTIFKPLYDAGIGIYPIRGNHEDDANDDITAWNAVFSGPKLLPQNGPAGEKNLTYSFICKNALVVGLDNYITIHQINQAWLNQQLASNSRPHIFVFGHEPAFKVFHADCLDDTTAARNSFWQSMISAGCRVYFCGHDHFFDAARIDDKDGNADNDMYQLLVGSGGGWLMSKYNYNGENDPYTPVGIFHRQEHGYVIVDIAGDGPDDKEVTVTWKERTYDTASMSFKYAATSSIIKYTATGNTALKNKSVSPAGSPEIFSHSGRGITFLLPRPEMITIALYTVQGRRILSMENVLYSAGKHTYLFPGFMSEGLYVCTVKRGTVTVQRSLITFAKQ